MSNVGKSKLIVKNTAFLYFRMLLVMLVSLYTSRVVLQTLGVTDFGIYNVVGGIVLILASFISSLSNATQRYMSIGLGKNDLKETEYAFRQSMTLMLVLSFLLFVVGETAGLWFVYNELTIPIERMDAAVWVYHFSLLSMIAGVNQVSFMGLVVTYERMNLYAYLGIFEAFARLFIVYILMWNESVDSLILYGGLTALISVVTLVLYMIYCSRKFSVCKLRLYWDAVLVKGMLRFVSYNLFGCLSWSAGVTGVNILLNIFFGPVVNAARAISMQVSSIITRFTESLITAIKPQIIKSYAANDKGYMISLIEKSSKYTFFLAAVLAIPIMFEVEFLLELWLGEVPEYTVIFTRLVLVASMIEVFFPLLWVAANATGDIKRSQVYGRSFTLAILPVSYIILKMDADPIIPFVITILSNICYWAYSFYDIHLQIQLSLNSYMRGVVKPAFFFSLGLTCMGSVVVFFSPDDSFYRLLIMALVTLVVAPCLVYVLLVKDEREMVKTYINKFYNKK